MFGVTPYECTRLTNHHAAIFEVCVTLIPTLAVTRAAFGVSEAS